MKTRTLQPNERLDWLRLARTAQVGPITFRQLLRRFGGPTEALNAVPEMAAKGGRKSQLKPPSRSEAEKEIEAVAAAGGKILYLCDADYPQMLSQIDDAPPVITVLGQISLLHKDTIAVVGARNASLNGRKIAETLSGELGQAGYIIASGLARGIDTSAHAKALQTGTIAVLAGGADVIYPEENRKLYEAIKETGCIVAEQPLGCQPQANLFPKRNRIISGLSLGTLVVEAAKQSGSLITARMALEQGREVFAIPGSPLDPRAAGCNELIRQGAVLTEKTPDILHHIQRPKNLFSDAVRGDYEDPPIRISESDLADSRQKIIENLSPSPISVDELARQCQLSLPLVLTVLLELELAGRLDRQPGHQVALIG